ncbi:MAG: hypothetical protein HN995_11920 [Candidatus Marinimicrobia bacterium]|jgi:hypothetical protein|nr:hypothetical protein [Candidatus Neomarinimicrobiota bacterium]MBT3576372.1 hypothetical protein [Candidatus Neomarinimicrobiota bacterium]MBT3680070.1 hypothetical protein [Candidatus Neomarinimicrobiota bacterium]MBT3950055.1 hypothetical protein [Candidatus Neomarinimicrobiota bacterium]MBT4254354.1 hypothetical protein [Candidatus Neomarinimicrobiota bacterium]
MINKIFSRLEWQPTHATLIAGVVVLLGFGLSEISWAFLSLAALGTFGPGILRELGILNDQDEFQRRADRQAGYHAFLTAGLFTFLLVTYLRSGDRNVEEPEVAVSLILAILWFTWFLSSLLSYWGPQKTVSRVLYGFGWVWLVFNIVGNLTDPIALIMQSLVAMPFFLLAYVAKRWPQIAGVVLIAVSAFFFYFFHLYEIFGPNPLEKGRGMVIILFMGPLLVSGIILLRNRVVEDES